MKRGARSILYFFDMAWPKQKSTNAHDNWNDKHDTTNLKAMVKGIT